MADTRRLSASLCSEQERPAPPRPEVRKSLVRRALGVNRQQFSGNTAADVSKCGRSSDVAELGVPRASPQLAWHARPPEGAAATKATLNEAMHAVHAQALKALQGTPAPPRDGSTVPPGAAWRVPRRPSHDGTKGRGCGVAREQRGLDTAMAFSRPGTQGGAGSERTCSASSSDSSSRKGSSSAQQQQTGGAADKGEEESGSESEAEEEEEDAGGSDAAPSGAAPLSKRRGAGSDGKAERKLALRRVQERRRTIEAAAEARERLGDAAREGKRKVQEAARQDKEGRDRYRAEVLAINRLLAQRDEAEFGAYMATRQPEVEEVEARHAAEMLQHAQARKAALREVAAAGALRHQQANEKEREKQARDREWAREREAQREAQREAKVQKEQEREAQRAQVYAVNKLMRQREEQAFGDFCEARGGLPPEPPPPEPPPKPKGTFAAPKPPTTDTVLLVPPAAGVAASEVAAIALSPAKPRRKRAASTSVPAAAIAAAAAVAISGGAPPSSHGAELHKKKQEYVASALELRRSHARTKGEEREVWRAQIYALNVLMKQREDASFSYFKELKDVRDAGGDESALPPAPSTGVPKALAQIQEMLVDKREEFRGQSRAPPPPPPPPPPPKKPPLPPSPTKRAAAIPVTASLVTAIPAGPLSAPLALPLPPPPVVSEPDTPLRTQDKG